MHIAVVTIFPEMLAAVTGYGITARAVKQGKLQVSGINPRDFTRDAHKTVDDRPFGGGPGMVMKIEPLRDATLAACKAVESATGNPQGRKPRVICLTPQGAVLTQARVEALAAEEGLVLVAGRYEGIDERFIDAYVDEELSIGDYVLSGGELAAMVLIDAVIRLLPGALGDEDSAKQDSFSGEFRGLLDSPHYTRPEVFEGRAVPPVLLGGNHAAIRRWRLMQALGRTQRRRPDLFAQKRAAGLAKEEQKLLDEYVAGQTDKQE